MSTDSMIPEDARQQTEALLKALQRKVVLVHFTQRQPCPACRDQRRLLEELAALSDRLELQVLDLERDAGQARALGVDKVPATVVRDADRDYGIRFFGLTLGYEYTSLLEDIAMVGSGRHDLPEEILPLLQYIREPLHLEVMVTLTCPYCAKMVRLVHQLAYVHEPIRGDMIDAAEFPQLVQRYQVHGVPRTVVNGRPAFEGALPPQQAMLEILRLANPEAWEMIDAQLRTLRGERQVRLPDPGHRYALAIVGAGPAALTAAIYAARKQIDTLLLAERVGGQINDTELIENYPGIPAIGGQDLAEALRRHAERFPVAERLGVRVREVRREGEDFLLDSGDAVWRARSVIWATGKHYRRLGLPGEERFLGRGVAFCATCDAPLYADRRVAVIGGGNSAFTAARDLLPWAREIHILNIADDWQADPVLVQEVRASDKVHLHPGTVVRAYLGEDQLQGIRVERRDGSDRFDLMVDGVFLEIGLSPNSEPLQGLATLNERGEVVVDRLQQTDVPGLFAAGDVSDEPAKQIIVAAGSGARAALAVHDWLQAHSGEED